MDGVEETILSCCCIFLIVGGSYLGFAIQALLTGKSPFNLLDWLNPPSSRGGSSLDGLGGYADYGGGEG